MTTEDMTSSGITANAVVVNAAEDFERKKKKTRSNSFSLLKVASMIFRTKQTEFFHQDEEGSAPPKQGKNNWKNIVGSMRPLTLQEKSPAISPSPTVENLQALASPPPSYISSSATMSRYASAVNLQDLDVNNESEKEEDPDDVFDAISGDDMIDAKAEEFIAQFYQQMRIQTASNY